MTTRGQGLRESPTGTTCKTTACGRSSRRRNRDTVQERYHIGRPQKRKPAWPFWRTEYAITARQKRASTPLANNGPETKGSLSPEGQGWENQNTGSASYANAPPPEQKYGAATPAAAEAPEPMIAEPAATAAPVAAV